MITVSCENLKINHKIKSGQSPASSQVVSFCFVASSHLCYLRSALIVHEFCAEIDEGARRLFSFEEINNSRARIPLFSCRGFRLKLVQRIRFDCFRVLFMGVNDFFAIRFGAVNENRVRPTQARYFGDFL